MRLNFVILLGMLCSSFAHTASCQVSAPSAFEAQTQNAVSTRGAFGNIAFTATAEWISGSTDKTGTAQLQAKVDGSTSLQLELGQASRAENQAAMTQARTCQWMDSSGASHEVTGANCFVAIPWFAPELFTQAPSILPAILAIKDDGVVLVNGTNLHQVSYSLNIVGADSTSTKRATDLSTVKVFYDTQTFLPVRLEYFLHPDNDESHNLDVTATFSNYQAVSGVMIPFHIEKYINRTLQIKLDVSSTTIN